MLAEEELVEHEAEVRIPGARIDQDRLGMALEHVAQRRLEKLHQVIDLLQLAQAVGVQGPVAADAMLFAVCAPGLPPVTAEEVRALGLQGRALPGGVEVHGDLPEAMRLNLWLRTASRVLLRLGEPFRATAFPELVRKASALP